MKSNAKTALKQVINKCQLVQRGHTYPQQKLQSERFTIMTSDIQVITRPILSNFHHGNKSDKNMTSEVSGLDIAETPSVRIGNC